LGAARYSCILLPRHLDELTSDFVAKSNPTSVACATNAITVGFAKKKDIV
jgi:hypothetical protein